MEFFEHLLEYRFLQLALLAGVLASVAGGTVGSYVVTKRITYLGGGIAHSVLGGMGVAYYLSVMYKWNGLHPVYGAIVAAIIAAVIIGLVSLKGKGREDTVIGAVWAIGMAVGIIFIYKTPGYNQDLMSYLFGNILMVRPFDLWMIGILDIFVIIIGFGFFRQLSAVCFDEEFARTRGINVEFYYLLLLIMTALTVVILVTVVGIVMVIALLTLPAATAGLITRKLVPMIFWSIGISIFYTVAGMGLSYGPDLPSGAVIILLAGGMFVTLSFVIPAIKRGWFSISRHR